MEIDIKKWQKMAGIIKEYNTEYSQPFEEQLGGDIFHREESDDDDEEGSKPLDPKTFKNTPRGSKPLDPTEFTDKPEGSEPLNPKDFKEETMLGSTGGPSKEGSIHLTSQDENPADEFSLEHLMSEEDEQTNLYPNEFRFQLEEDMDFRKKVIDHLVMKGFDHESIIDLLIRQLSDEDVYDALEEYLGDMQ